MKIADSIKVTSIGFQIFDLNFGKRHKRLKLLNILLNDLFGSSSAPSKSFYVNNDFNQSSCERDRQDIYTFITNSVSPDDDYSKRLADRKHNDLTKKGREGFVHIKLGEISGIPVIFNQKAIKGEIMVDAFLHVDTERLYDENDKKRNIKGIASASFIISLTHGSQNDFVRTDIRHTFVDISEENINRFEQVAKNVAKSVKKETKNMNNWDFLMINRKPDHNFVQLRVYLLWYIWERFLKNYRTQLYSHENNGELRERYLSGCRFIRSIDDLIGFLSFNSVSVAFDNNGGNNEELRSDIETFFRFNYVNNPGTPAYEWLDLLADIFEKEDNKQEPWKNSFFILKPSMKIKRDLEGALYFQNMRFFPSYIESESFQSGKLYQTNLRWDAVWALILGDTLCTMAETFLSYNSMIEGYISEHGKTSVMYELMHSAVIDLANYYDSDIIHTLELRSALESAEETFFINNYHNRLKSRLEMFSNYDIEENERKLNAIISYGGFVAFIVLSVSADSSLYRLTDTVNVHLLLFLIFEVVAVLIWGIYYYWIRKK